MTVQEGYVEMLQSLSHASSAFQEELPWPESPLNGQQMSGIFPDLGLDKMSLNPGLELSAINGRGMRDRQLM